MEGVSSAPSWQRFDKGDGVRKTDEKQVSVLFTEIYIHTHTQTYVSNYLLVLPYVLYGKPLCRIILKHS